MDWRPHLERYLESLWPAAGTVSIARVTGMPAGASNETAALDLSLTCGDVEVSLPVVLRPQRAAGPLAPYDVERQYRILRALARTGVPVPAAFAFEPTPDVLGAPFFLMSRVSGHTLPIVWYGSSLAQLPPVALALATVHRVDWRAAGLDFLLPGDQGQVPPAARATDENDAIARSGDAELPLPASGERVGVRGGPSPLQCELHQWDQRAAYRGLDRHEPFQQVRQWLIDHEPDDARHALLHGDTNPGNYLIAPRGQRVAAVLDWELAAIGDPRSDLGFYAALAALFGGGAREGGVTVLSEAYEATTGQPLGDLTYYEIWGLYRMLIVMGGFSGMIGGWGWGGSGILQRIEALTGERFTS